MLPSFRRRPVRFLAIRFAYSLLIKAVDETLAVDRHLYGPRHEEGKQDEY